jgi:hypothetical protein
MTQNIKSLRASRPSALRIAGLALLAVATLGSFSIANAQHGGGGHGGGGGGGGGGHSGGGGFHGGGGGRGGFRGGGFGGYGGWNGGYYGEPPVVFGSPYCASPLIYRRGRAYQGYCE